MEYGTISGVDKRVSRLVLGSMVFSTEKQDVTNELLDRWLDVPGIPREALSPYGNRARVADRLLDVVAAPSTPSSMDNLGGLVFTAMLCDRIGATFGLAGHHLLRTARHRVHRLAPALVPESWSA